jgi:hypothetical protein
MKTISRRSGRGLVAFAVFTAIIVVGLPIGGAFYLSAKTIHDLLGENRKLKEAITNLTTEEQIGYAKVVSQETRDGSLHTTLKFVETARGDKLKTILEKEFTVEGDVIHFDALIVKFGDQMVMDGSERALYLWRRVYGEAMAPRNGFPIEEVGREPVRYADLFDRFPFWEREKAREMFWPAVWDLANDPKKLQDYGIAAIYGSATYTQLRPGLIYVFKIGATGQVYPEVVPSL